MSWWFFGEKNSSKKIHNFITKYSQHRWIWKKRRERERKRTCNACHLLLFMKCAQKFIKSIPCFGFGAHRTQTQTQSDRMKSSVNDYDTVIALN